MTAPQTMARIAVRVRWKGRGGIAGAGDAGDAGVTSDGPPGNPGNGLGGSPLAARRAS